MSKKKNSNIDSVRRIALLWGSQGEAGRSGLSVKAIVKAAIEIADAEGVDALSMRRVADRIDVGTMSLYTHIPGKEDLIELMFDTAYGKLYASMDEPSQKGGNWRDAMRFVARRNWELFQLHPWMLQMLPGRPVLGPNATRKYEAELRPLDGQGLSDVEMDASLTLILTHVEGCARAQSINSQVRQNSGMTDEEWWVIQAPLIDKVVDPEHFPVSTRVGVAAGQAYQAASNPEYALGFGLERILDGIAELIRLKTSDQAA